MCPELRSQDASHALAFIYQAHPLGRRIKAYAIAKAAEGMEHHVNVVNRELPALVRHPRFLSQDVEVKTQTIPSYDFVSAFSLSIQIVDQSLQFPPVHSPCRTLAIGTAVPEHRLIRVAQ
jgi:hypothetical protein